VQLDLDAKMITDGEWCILAGLIILIILNMVDMSIRVYLICERAKEEDKRRKEVNKKKQEVNMENR